MKTALTLTLILLLGGCASQPQGRVTNAAATPLSDFNLVRDEIPPILIEAKHTPYALPKSTDCHSLQEEIGKFDIVLGPDLDSPEGGGASNVVGDAAINALADAAGGIVPFRSWVRKLSGAEQHARETAAAIGAGAVRRAFLKGLAVQQGCQASAATR